MNLFLASRFNPILFPYQKTSNLQLSQSIKYEFKRSFDDS